MTVEAGIGRLLTDSERPLWPYGGVLRSGFVVDAKWVLTAWHCVRDVGGENARLWLRLQPRNSAEAFADVPVRYAAHDGDLDIALLAVDGKHEFLAERALRLGRSVQPGAAVRVGGFPERNNARYSVVFNGTVESADALIGRHPAIRVHVPAFAARYAESPGGMSGGPLLRQGGDPHSVVVGIVVSYPRFGDDRGATGGGVICRRIAEVCDRFPQIAALAPEESGRAVLGPTAGDSLIRLPMDQPGGAVRGRTAVFGREALLRQLSAGTGNSRLRRRSTVWVLHGLGGSGKTTVAWAAARRAQERGVQVWWISASEPTQLSAGMRRLSIAVGGTQHEVDAAWVSNATAAALVWQLLNAYPHQWLLILDNADHADVLEIDGSPLPDGRGWLQPVTSRRGAVIVTSRDRNAEHFGSWCRMAAVEMLPRSAGGRFLLDLAGPSSGSLTDAQALADRLGGLPLALRLAGSNLASAIRAPLPGDVVTMDELLRTLDRPKSVIADNLRAVWQRSLDHLAARGAANAQSVLRLLATFAAAPIPFAVLIVPTLERSPLFTDIDRTALRAAIESLIDLGLVESSDRGAMLHPLVRDAARLDAEDDRADYLGLAVELLAEASSGDTEDPTSWRLWESIEPHAAYLWTEVTTRSAPAQEMARRAAEIAVQAGRSLRARGLYMRASSELQRVVDGSVPLLGADDRITLWARLNLARATRDLGRYPEAENEFRQVLSTAALRLGDADELTLRARQELARVLHAEGRLTEAEAELRGALAESEGALGDEHWLTLAIRYEFARALFSRKHWTEALAQFRAVQGVEERLFGGEHQDTLNARHQAARAAMHIGDLAAAEQDIAAVLSIRQRLMGPRHPTTVATQYNLAEIHFRNGELVTAEREIREVIDLSTEIIGAEHPGTLSARYDLAAVLAATGRTARAAQELRHVLDARTRALGADHPTTIVTRRELDRLLSSGEPTGDINAL